MDDEVIDKLWGQSNHGTYREDIEAAYIAGYNAGLDAEREACAKLCDAGVDTPHPTVNGHVMLGFGKSPTLAAAIRLRSNAGDKRRA